MKIVAGIVTLIGIAGLVFSFLLLLNGAPAFVMSATIFLMVVFLGAVIWDYAGQRETDETYRVKLVNATTILTAAIQAGDQKQIREKALEVGTLVLGNDKTFNGNFMIFPPVFFHTSWRSFRKEQFAKYCLLIATNPDSSKVEGEIEALKEYFNPVWLRTLVPNR